MKELTGPKVQKNGQSRISEHGNDDGQAKTATSCANGGASSMEFKLSTRRLVKCSKQSALDDHHGGLGLGYYDNHFSWHNKTRT